MVKSKPYNVFLDDYRRPQDAYSYTRNMEYLEENWIVVKDYVEFVNLISENYVNGRLPAIISFDHDLADQHYLSQSDIDYSSFRERTGYDCAKWLINFCIDVDVKLPEWRVHSMNPVGRANIESLLKNFKCEYCDSEGYHKTNCVKNK
jgi:hypothetical protein